MKNKLLFKYIFIEHSVPFIGANVIISFLFLSNFILKSLDRLLGKNLGTAIIFEFITLNLAWIFAMAIPMSVLISVLMVFGRLGEDNEITAIRSNGISFTSILLPSLLFAFFVMLFLLWFNNNVLPDANHKARLLRGDIYRKHPDLNLEPGYFIYDIPNYTIYMKDKDGEVMKDLIIFHNESNGTKITIWAKEGRMMIMGNYVIMDLKMGEIHELPGLDKESEYHILEYDKHRITIPVENMMLERRDKARKGDREMDIPSMQTEINRYIGKQNKLLEQSKNLIKWAPPDSNLETSYLMLTNMINDSLRSLENTGDKLSRSELKNQKKIKNYTRRIESNIKITNSYQKQINKYKVEIHKKIAMPVACIIFIMIGAPLGMIARRGGMAIAAGLSLLFFLIYWALMMGGEQLSDRNLLEPWIAMWGPNILFFFAGILLIWYAIHERINIRIPNLFKVFSKEASI